MVNSPWDAPVVPPRWPDAPFLAWVCTQVGPALHLTRQAPAFAAALDVSQEYLQAGIKFSWPIYKTGLKIMVGDTWVRQGHDIWAFTTAFDGYMWLAVLLTSLGVGVFVWGAELLVYGRHDPELQGKARGELHQPCAAHPPLHIPAQPCATLRNPAHPRCP